METATATEQLPLTDNRSPRHEWKRDERLVEIEIFCYPLAQMTPCGLLLKHGLQRACVLESSLPAMLTQVETDEEREQWRQAEQQHERSFKRFVADRVRMLADAGATDAEVTAETTKAASEWAGSIPRTMKEMFGTERKAFASLKLTTRGLENPGDTERREEQTTQATALATAFAAAVGPALRDAIVEGVKAAVAAAASGGRKS